MSDSTPPAAPALAAAPEQPQSQESPTSEQPTVVEPVVFTAQQQEKIDVIVRAAMGRAGREAREQLATERAKTAQLETELEAAQTLVRSRDTAAVEELQTQIQLLKLEVKTEKQLRLDAESRAIDFRRSALVAQQSLQHGFVDPAVVAAMVERNLPWDSEKQAFAVVNQDGSPKLLPTGEQMTPRDFFDDFAQQKPYMVKSDARTGSGAEHSARSGLPAAPRHKPEELFGKNSDAAKANTLAQREPQTYRALKKEAQRRGLI